MDAVTLACFALAGIAAFLSVLWWIANQMVEQALWLELIPLFLAIALVSWIWT